MGLFDFFKKKNSLDSENNTASIQKSLDTTSNLLKEKGSSGKDGCISSSNLSAGEIEFLRYADGHDADIQTFSQKFKYEFNLNYPKTLSMLKKMGLIRIGSLQENLALYTMNELKSILKENNLPASGKKEDLIKRLNDNNVNLESRCTKKMYLLTETGKKIVRQYEIGNPSAGVSSTDLNIQFMSLSKKVQQHSRNGQIGLYACDLYSMSEIHRKEEHYNDQLTLLILSAYYHLSGIGNLEDYKLTLSNCRLGITPTLPPPILPPAVIRETQKALERLRLNIDDYRKKYYEEITISLIPMHILGTDKCLDVICLYLTGNSNKAEKEIKTCVEQFCSELVNKYPPVSMPKKNSKYKITTRMTVTKYDPE